MDGPGDKGRKQITAGELLAELESDPEYLARLRQAEETCERNLQRYRMAARGVLADLRAAGFEVESVGDLRRLGRYSSAVPVLMRWLPRIQDSAVKEDIVRTLSVPWAKAAAPLLIAEFERAEAPGLRWAIGNALEVLASDENAAAMIGFATDRKYGADRQMVVIGLGKVNVAGIDDVLIGLLGDEDVTGHAVIALGKRRAKAARPHVEALLRHPKSWVRKEAKKALKLIDKGG